MNPRLEWSDYEVRLGDRFELKIGSLVIEGPGLALLCGATGSGKTTLLRTATGLLQQLGGADVTGTFRTDPAAAKLAYLPQDASDAFLSADPANEYRLRARASGSSRAQAEAIATTRLAALDLSSRADSPFENLSAGERKRLAFDVVQTHAARVLLVDEPFNHLDADWRRRFLVSLVAASTDRLVVVATHDVHEFLPHASRAIVLREGRVAFDGASRELGARVGEFPEIARPIDPPQRFPAGPGRPAVRLENLTLEGGGRLLVRNANAELGTGIHVVVGPNGSGKTTLLRAIMGLVQPAGGKVLVAGQDPAAVGPAAMSRVATMAFEEPTRMFCAPTVHQEASFAPFNQRLEGCDVEARVRAALSDFDLDGVGEESPHALSGGESELLALACTATAEPHVLLLDEPTQGLDGPGRRILFAHLARLAATTCVLAATHDADLASRASTLIEIRDGRLEHRLSEVAARIPS